MCKVAACLTFMEITKPPRPLAVPEESENRECYDIVIMEVFGVSKDQLTSLLRPFDHEAMVLQVGFSMIITIKTGDSRISQSSS